MCELKLDGGGIVAFRYTQLFGKQFFIHPAEAPMAFNPRTAGVWAEHELQDRALKATAPVRFWKRRKVTRLGKRQKISCREI